MIKDKLGMERNISLASFTSNLFGNENPGVNLHLGALLYFFRVFYQGLSHKPMLRLETEA